MLYSIKSGTNHYETLGLGPEASFEEIERAYRREMSPLHPRAFGSLGSVTVAYETLRDPVKRRDYDASIGIVRPEPVRVQRRDFHFAGSAHFTGAGIPFPEAAPAAPPAPVEPKPFIAAAPAPAEAPRAEAPKPRPDPATAPMIEDLLREYQARDGKKPAGEAEAAFEWKRPAAVAGGFVLAVTLLGGLVGSWSGSAVDEPKAPARSTTKLLVPPAEGLTAMDASAEAAEEPTIAPVAAVQPVVERRRAPRVQARPADRLAGVAEAIDSPVVEAAVQPEADASAPVEAAVIPASAPAPIPNAVIARTIHKIGYACGRVASTSPVEGSGSGVFKVTCTSGHSYQATPVHGRYRFRRSQ